MVRESRYQKAVGIAIGVGLALGVACSPAPQAPPVPPTSAPAAQPKGPAPAVSAPTAAPAAVKPSVPSVQRVVMAVSSPATENNEVRHLDQPSTWQLRPMYEYLIGVDEQTGKLIPQLATEWSLEPDGTSFRFKLRRGVQFHGGNGEFTAKDVVHSWTDLTKEDSFHGQAPWWKQLISRFDVVDDYEIIFRLTRPDANFLRALSEAEGAMEIRSKAHFDAVGAPTMQSAPMAGTGPYQFKERVQGQYIRFERVPYQHWRTNPEFPEFEFRFQREPSTRAAALFAGEAHLASIPQDMLADAESKGFKVIRGHVPGLRTFFSLYCCYLNDSKDPSKGMRFPDSPLADVRVRKALNKAVNRDELNRAFFAGKGETMYLNHYHPTRAGWKDDWVQRFPEEYGYDPARARALLAEAGKSSITTNMFIESLTQYSGAEDVTEAVVGYWRAIGVGVESVQIDPTQRTAARREYKFSNHANIIGTSSGQLLGIGVYNSEVSAKGSGAQDPDLERVVQQLFNTLDEPTQEALYQKAGDILYSQHLNIPLFWLPAEIVVSPKIVSDYVFPGSISGTWTHVQNIKAAK